MKYRDRLKSFVGKKGNYYTPSGSHHFYLTDPLKEKGNAKIEAVEDDFVVMSYTLEAYGTSAVILPINLFAVFY
jgi:hypothetical protein